MLGMHGETLHAMQPEPKTQSTRAFATTRARQQIVLGFKQETGEVVCVQEHAEACVELAASDKGQPRA